MVRLSLLLNQLLPMHHPGFPLSFFRASSFFNQFSFFCGRDDLFFAFYLLLREKLSNCGHDDFFFALHLILRGKLDTCSRNVDLFSFLPSLDFA